MIRLEMNLAENAEAMAAGKHDGWEPTCWDGIQQSLEVISEKSIKIIVNGGALNPDGLARKTQKLVRQYLLFPGEHPDSIPDRGERAQT
jgi:hypothetical protein